MSTEAEEGVLPRGTKVGEYVVEEAVAAGGFGQVYRVTHPVIGKSAAIKVLRREMSSNPDMVSRFIAEARVVNQIRHKNIVDIFAFGALEDGRHYCVMELCDGPTLDQVVKQRGAMPVQEALPILRQLGRALEAAHAAGVTHRDLKPENVILTYDEDGKATPKLLDFGIAKLRDQSESTHRTRSGTPMGTPLYMSPELVDGQPADHRSDIYSLGVLVHEVLTGRPPFDGRSVMEVLAAHATRPPPAMSSVTGVPAELDAPVLRMLDKVPDNRPQSVSEAIAELSAAAERAGLVQPASGVGVTARAQSVRDPDAVSSREALSTATTLAAQSKTTGTSRPTSTATYLFAAAGIVLALGAGIALSVRRPATPASAPSDSVSTAATLVSATATPTAEAEPTIEPVGAKAERVKISFSGAPAATEVLIGGKKVGTTDEPIELAKSQSAVRATLRRAGYLPLEVTFVPDEDRTVGATLKPTPPGRRGNRDLEF